MLAEVASREIIKSWLHAAKGLVGLFNRTVHSSKIQNRNAVAQHGHVGAMVTTGKPNQAKRACGAMIRGQRMQRVGVYEWEMLVDVSTFPTWDGVTLL